MSYISEEQSADYELKIDEILNELTKICETNKYSFHDEIEENDPPMMYGDLKETLNHWLNNCPPSVMNIELSYVDTIEFLYTGNEKQEDDISKDCYLNRTVLFFL